jgi:hypothetical protein
LSLLTPSLVVTAKHVSSIAPLSILDTAHELEIATEIYNGQQNNPKAKQVHHHPDLTKRQAINWQPIDIDLPVCSAQQACVLNV